MVLVEEVIMKGKTNAVFAFKNVFPKNFTEDFYYTGNLLYRQYTDNFD